jgi:hypothetical protein
MAMEPKIWMIAISFNKWILHFIAFVQAHGCNVCTINHQLFILDGQDSHYTIYVHKAKGVQLDLITLQATHYNLLMLRGLNHSKLHMDASKVK